MLSVKGDDRLKAATLALKAAPREVRKIVTDDTRTVMGPVWVGEVNARASTRADTLVIAKGARIKSGNPPTAVAASSTRKLRGGLIPADTWGPIEFGSPGRDKATTYRRKNRKGGGTHSVTRRTRAQLPAAAPAGRVAFPAFAEVAPRVVALWVASIVRAYYTALQGGR